MNDFPHNSESVGELTIVSRNEEETQLVAQLLGELVDVGQLIGLIGTLGAGKTCFVQGLARGLGVHDGVAVSSPTYTYMNEYIGRLPLYHMDLYRVDSLDSLEELGYRDYYFGDGVCAVEWFGQVPQAIPQAFLLVEFLLMESERQLRFQAKGVRESKVLAALAKRWYALAALPCHPNGNRCEDLCGGH